MKKNYIKSNSSNQKELKYYKNIFLFFLFVFTAINTSIAQDSFETGLDGWVNASGDNFDWTRDSGGTPSGSTGPSTGATGNFYMFIEASDPRVNGDKAWLQKEFSLINRGNGQLNFKYHMFGDAGMGTLNVLVSTDNGISFSTVFSLSRNQGDAWLSGTADLSGYSNQSIIVRFEGIRGLGFRSDLAIDDIELTSQELDSDNDGVSDSVDLDDDNDGILDSVECPPIPSGALNSPNYPSRNDNNANSGTELQESAQPTGDGTTAILPNVFGGLANLTATLIDASGGSTPAWNNGVQILDDGAPVNDYFYFQPSGLGGFNAANPAAGDHMLVTLDLKNGATNFQLTVAGLNNGDTFEFEASYQGNPITITAANFDNLDDNNPSGTGTTVVTANGTGLQGDTSVGGTEVDANRGRITIPGPVDTVIIRAGKNEGSNGTVTSAITLVSFDSLVLTDDDGDGIPNCLDLDSDGDGCFDAEEGAANLTGTAIDAQGRLTASVGTTGIPTSVNQTNGQAIGGSNNANVTACSCPFPSGVDSDNDGIDNICDLDDDNDGILDTDEGCQIITGSTFTLNSSLSVLGDVNSGGKLVYEDTNGNTVVLEAAGTVGNNNVITNFGPNDGTIVTDITTGNIVFEIGASGSEDDQPKLKVSTFSSSGLPFKITSIGLGGIGNMDNSEAQDAIAIDVPGSWSNLSSGSNTLGSAQIRTSPVGAVPVANVTQAELDNFNFINFVAQGAVSEVIFNNADNNIQFGYNATFTPKTPVSSFNLIVDDININDGVGRNIVAELLTTSITIGAIICRDTDGDGIEDSLDSDSDGDGCSDADEAYYGTVANADADDNGFYGTGVPNVDADGKVVGASYATPTSFYIDASKNTCLDTDNDGVANFADLDDDNDGILDTVEDNCTTPTKGFFDWDTDFGVTPSNTNIAGNLPIVSNLVDNHNLTVSFTDNAANPGLEFINISNAFGLGTVLQVANASGETGGGITKFNFSNEVNNLTFSMQDIDARGSDFKDRVIVTAKRNDGTTIIISETTNIISKGSAVSYVGNNEIIGIADVDSPNQANGVITLKFFEPVSEISFQYFNDLTSPNTRQRIGIADLQYEFVCDIDSDNDGIPNSLDSDSDNDGCSDADEAYYGTVTNADGDNNGFYGSGTPTVDTSGKVTTASYGTPNSYYLNSTVKTCNDEDNDGIPNALDLDDDNDGITDVTEGYGFYTDGSGTCDGFSYSFKGGTYITGTGSGAGTLNAQYRFPLVNASLDAIVTIVQKSPSVSILSIDQNLGDNDAFQPRLRFATGAVGADLSIQFRFSFVLTGTTTPSTVDRVGGFIQDIDGASGIKEFYKVQNIVGYSIGEPSNISVTQTGAELKFISKSNMSAPVEPVDTDNRYRSFFQKRDTNQFLFTIGAEKTRSAQIDRYFSIRFDECRIDLYNNPRHVFFNAEDNDSDGIPDYLDTDSDNDGCPDAIEGAGAIMQANLTSLTGGSVGGSLFNLGTASNATGNPLLNGAGLGYEQNTTAAVLDNTLNDACLVDLSLTKTIDKPIKKVGDTIVFTIILKNDGDADATNVMVKDLLPAGLTYNAAGSVIPTNTTYTASTGIWDLSLLTIKKGETKTLKIGATVATAGTIITNKTEVFSANESDKDSTSNNNN
ncbi:hypothetical protein [Polaribacter aestuariivivens]|uniref:hypothetical protein n=1 Tax=Polaribacter aestuariivivens TaxID=2304626 RepID=UPI003F495398